MQVLCAPYPVTQSQILLLSVSWVFKTKYCFSLCFNSKRCMTVMFELNYIKKNVAPKHWYLSIVPNSVKLWSITAPPPMLAKHVYNEGYCCKPFYNEISQSKTKLQNYIIQYFSNINAKYHLMKYFTFKVPPCLDEDQIRTKTVIKSN